jgi:hypothetical protein
MMTPEEEIIHLKSTVQRQGPGKLTFTMKIHRLLAFTQKHPESAPDIGLIWTNEAGIFLMNSRQLAKYLGIRTNSINTNLREHGFERVKTSPLTQTRVCQLTGISLPDERLWKKVRQTLMSFLQTSDELVAQQVDREVRPTIMARRFHGTDGEDSTPSEASPEHASQILMRPMASFAMMLNFLPSDMVDDVHALLMKTRQNHTHILELAIRHWTDHAGRVERTRLDSFLASLFRGDDLHASVLTINCHYLLGTCANQRRFFSNLISFIDFLCFFLRFGSCAGITRTLDSLSLYETFSEAPAFRRGFCFGLNLAVVQTIAQPGEWAVIEGDECDAFSLLLHEIVTIRVDPTDETRYLTLEAADGTPVSVRSWPDLLARLGLAPQDGAAASGMFCQARGRDAAYVAYEPDDFMPGFFQSDM